MWADDISRRGPHESSLSSLAGHIVLVAGRTSPSTHWKGKGGEPLPLDPPSGPRSRHHRLVVKQRWGGKEGRCLLQPLLPAAPNPFTVRQIQSWWHLIRRPTLGARRRSLCLASSVLFSSRKGQYPPRPLPTLPFPSPSSLSLILPPAIVYPQQGLPGGSTGWQWRPLLPLLWLVFD